jgi:hypothetical protein
MLDTCGAFIAGFKTVPGGFRGRLLVRLALVCCTLFLALTAAYAKSVSSSELIENARQYDGQTITYAGEVIGDVMVRGRFAWINVNDGKNAIGIWLDRELAKDIAYTGSYTSRGDWVEVEGVFHRACLQHGGDLDIHALALRKTKDGEKIDGTLSLHKRNLAFALLGVLCLVLILRQLKIKRIQK